MLNKAIIKLIIEVHAKLVILPNPEGKKIIIKKKRV